MTKTEQTQTSCPTETGDIHPSVKIYTPRLEEFDEALALIRKR